jgi:hypothetical protein
MKRLNISCKKAAGLMVMKEAKVISFWDRFRLSYHLMICSLCRLFYKQDNWLQNNINKVDEHCKGCLSEADKQAILEKLH